MSHLTEEELIEQAYGESADRDAVERHLVSCRRCADSLADLERDLSGIRRIEAPARDAGYGERVWASIAASLPIYETVKRPWLQRWGWSGLALRGLSYAAACALLVSSAFYAGRRWEQHQQPPAVAHLDQRPAQAKQPIVVVVLNDHLDRSERFLVQLKHADLDSAAMVSPMRDEAKSLLAANKECRKNLGEEDDPELTTALDHLNSLLAEAVNEPGGLDAQSIARLQDKMNADGLLFEVRVLRSRIRHHSGSGQGASKGATI
jgi:hypothetical protein